ncbi:class I adenylate-forming enzyme family protein [Microbacterium hydrocarbonoxydans]|uniref:class I adenylate-forming enzyme family protein n=1 Tax=Microbacterium hydrocarbonoxydans TaxID=273678 RepID=UPI0013D9B8AF|nr:fatty acid--CoA ligase family protein [Microbacterium hydrocarbonoxydans]
MLRRAAAADPGRLALVGSDRSLTRAELLEDAARLSAGLDALRPEGSAGRPVVALCLDAAFDVARLVVAAEYGDRIVCVLDPRWPASVRLALLLAAGADLLVTADDDLRAPLAEAGWTGRIARLDELRGAAASAPVVPPADAPFLLLFSSGTTGAPKAFLKTRAQYAANIAASRAHLGAAEGVATFAPGALSFSLTLYALFEALGTGGRMHVADSLDELWLTGRVQEEGATRVVAVASALHALADAADRHPDRYDGLDLVVTGGAALSPSVRSRLAASIPRAEVIAYLGAGELGFLGDSRSDDPAITLYPHVEARIRDDDGRDVAPGGLGTLWVRSASCSDGYLPSTTTEPLTDAEGWATVHDQGRLRGRAFTFAGRRGDVITTGGHTVALGDVEQAFDGMPGLGAACAVALPHERLGTVIALVAEGAAPPKPALQAWAAERLAPASVPRRWYALPSLPRTASGKVRRTETAALLTDGPAVRL